MLWPGAGPELSPELASMVDVEVKRLVEEAHDRARQTLLAKRDLLDRLSDLLMVTEVIEGEALRRYVDGGEKIPTIDEARARQAAGNGNGKAETTPTGPGIVVGGEDRSPIPPPPPGSLG
jgi:hypothetical protein